MADEAAHSWSVAEIVPAAAGGPDDADLLAAAKRSGAKRGAAHSANHEK